MNGIRRLLATLGLVCLMAAAVTAQPLPDPWQRLKQEVDHHWLADSATPGPELDRLLLTDPERVRGVVWESYRSSWIHGAANTDFKARRVRWKEHESPYTIKEVGKRPENGWPLFIALHGGGGVAKEVNDSQWKQMQRYYRDHPEVGGYLYLALRAPNDRWNGFYDVAISPLIEQLIRQFLLFGDVDPDKVFLMGYSHGGYGAFSIGPKIPYRFAAVHSSAAAPSGDQSPARNLRNTIFTFMIGEKDEAHGRIERCRSFAAEIEALRKQIGGGYPVTMELIEGHGHGGLPDRDKIASMYPALRQPIPRELSWHLTDSVLESHFWLRSHRPVHGARVDARLAENELVIDARDLKYFSVGLDHRLVDVRRPLRVQLSGGEPFEVELQPSVTTLCTWMNRLGDPRLAMSVEIHFSLD